MPCGSRSRRRHSVKPTTAYFDVGVDAVRGRRDEAGDRGRVHDVARPALLDHARHEGVHAVDRAPEVHAEHPLPVGERALVDEPEREDARVVAEEVAAAELAERARRERLDRVGAPHVDAGRDRAPPALAHLRGDALDLRGLDVGERDVHARLRARERERGADAAPAARDRRDAPCELLHLSSPFGQRGRCAPRERGRRARASAASPRSTRRGRGSRGRALSSVPRAVGAGPERREAHALVRQREVERREALHDVADAARGAQHAARDAVAPHLLAGEAVEEIGDLLPAQERPADDVAAGGRAPERERRVDAREIADVDEREAGRRHRHEIAQEDRRACGSSRRARDRPGPTTPPG